MNLDARENYKSFDTSEEPDVDVRPFSIKRNIEDMTVLFIKSFTGGFDLSNTECNKWGLLLIYGVSSISPPYLNIIPMRHSLEILYPLLIFLLFVIFTSKYFNLSDYLKKSVMPSSGENKPETKSFTQKLTQNQYYFFIHYMGCAILVSSSLVYLLKKLKFSAIQRILLGHTISSAHLSLLIGIYHYETENSYDAKPFKRSYYILLCTTAVAVIDLSNSFTGLLKFKIEIFNESIDILQFNQNLITTLNYIVPLFCILFGLQLLPDFTDFVVFLKKKSSREARWIKYATSRGYRMAFTLGRTIVNNIWEQKATKQAILFCVQVGIGYLVFSKSQIFQYTSLLSAFYALLYSTAYANSRGLINHFVDFLIKGVYGLLYSRKKKEEQQLSETKPTIVFGDLYEEKPFAPFKRHQDVMICILIYITTFVVAYLLIYFTNEMTILKASLVTLSIVMGIVQYPILTEPWVYWAFMFFLRMVLPSRRKQHKGISSMAQNIHVCAYLLHAWILNPLIILFAIIDTGARMSVQNKPFPCALAIVGFSKMQIEQIYKSPNSLPFSLLLVGLFRKWDSNFWVSYSVVEIRVASTAIYLIIQALARIKAFISFLTYKKSKTSIFIYFLFYAIGLNPYIVLLFLASTFNLTIYKVLNSGIFFVTYKRYTMQKLLPKISMKPVCRSICENFKKYMETTFCFNTKIGLFGYVSPDDCYIIVRENIASFITIDDINYDSVTFTLSAMEFQSRDWEGEMITNKLPNIKDLLLWQLLQVKCINHTQPTTTRVSVRINDDEYSNSLLLNCFNLIVNLFTADPDMRHRFASLDASLGSSLSKERAVKLHSIILHARDIVEDNLSRNKSSFCVAFNEACASLPPQDKDEAKKALDSILAPTLSVFHALPKGSSHADLLKIINIHIFEHREIKIVSGPIKIDKKANTILAADEVEYVLDVTNYEVNTYKVNVEGLNCFAATAINSKCCTETPFDWIQTLLHKSTDVKTFLYNATITSHMESHPWRPWWYTPFYIPSQWLYW